jgi:hypothetical protein
MSNPVFQELPPRAYPTGKQKSITHEITRRSQRSDKALGDDDPFCRSHVPSGANERRQ